MVSSKAEMDFCRMSRLTALGFPKNFLDFFLTKSILYLR